MTIPAARDCGAASPPWDAAGAGADVDEIVIDPGQAFGTGAHATTRLCLELLLELPPAARCVDLGCGSGVLAIAAAKLGFAPVLGVDHDPRGRWRATEATRRVNGVARRRSRRFDLRHDGAGAGRRRSSWPTCCARCCSRRRAASPAPAPAAPVASGLLPEEGDEVAAAFAERHGLRERARAGHAGLVRPAARGLARG